jgi:hypothetical protein
VAIVRFPSEPRYLVRPGPSDHILLDRLLSPDLFSGPVKLDGMVVEAPHVGLYRDFRGKLDMSAMVLVDPQAYRLQRESCAEHPGLQKLPYADPEGPFDPTRFDDPNSIAEFVKQVLDHQHQMGVTSYVAPAFFVDSTTSPWVTVNAKLLHETRTQAGSKVFATVCGNYSAFCGSAGASTSLESISEAGVEGVLVLLSPMQARGDGPSKLANYLRFLAELGECCPNVIACRQPAFGLAYMALGVSGFDSGIATAERFDYSGLTRSLAAKQRSGPSRNGPRPRRRMVYIPHCLQLCPTRSPRVSFSTSGVAGSFVCEEPCCGHNISGALTNYREHFIYSRLKEVAVMRGKPLRWRQEHFGQQLVASRQMADKVTTAFPNLPISMFRHLDVWSRVVAGVTPKPVAV